MADVKSKLSAAVSGDFASSSGTPIVCNQTSGEIAVMKADNSVFIIGSDKAGISQVHYVGTTSIAANRASAPQALTGITSIDGNSATSTLAINSTTAATVSTTVASGAVGTTQTALDNSTKIATTAYADNAGRSVLATSQTTTSGTSKDFTGIPSIVSRITIMLDGVSTNGTSILLVQLGAGSIVSSGYETNSLIPGVAAYPSTAGFSIASGAGAQVWSGMIIFSLLKSGTWIGNGQFYNPVATTYHTFSVGHIASLGGTLDRVRLTTGNGTDTFDAGVVNIMYE